jgi:hypothetical protein
MRIAIEKPDPEELKEFLIPGREPINLPRRLARVRYELIADQIPQRNEMTRCANSRRAKPSECRDACQMKNFLEAAFRIKAEGISFNNLEFGLSRRGRMRQIFFGEKIG